MNVSHLIGLAAAGDSGSSRLVYAIVIGLVVIGIAFVVIAAWLIRATRVESELLAPLERMGDRKWRHSDSDSKQLLLEEVRPDGARSANGPALQDPPIATEFAQPDLNSKDSDAPKVSEPDPNLIDK